MGRLLFVLGFGILPVSAQALIIEREAIRVESEVITYTEFLDYFMPLRDRLVQEGEGADRVRQARTELITTLIQGLTLFDYAEAYASVVRESEVDRIVASMMTEQQLTEAELTEQVFAEYGVPSLKLFKWQLRMLQTRERMLQQMQYLPGFSIDPVTQADIQACYNENFSDNAASERREVFHMVFLVDDPNPFGEEMEAAQGRADAALARLEAGEDFEAVAGELSDDRFTRAEGGRLGLMNRQDISQYSQDFGLDYGRAAFDLEEGEVSAALRSRRGLHVLFVKTVEQDETMTLDEASEPCRLQLTQQRYSQLLAEEVERHGSQVQIRVMLEGAAY